MPAPIRYGLADCNNFYCSCEQVFDPRLANTPLVVLSNNDGVAIARSKEAKALGIRMGDPWHLIRRTKGAGVTALSSNYALYANMSNRVMAIIGEMAPAVEVYSIDEAFCRCDGISDLVEFGQRMKQTVAQYTGLAIGVGFGSTKTRAKLSQHVSKTRPEHGGVFDLETLSTEDCHSLLASIDVAEVWGVGRRLAPKLTAMGFPTVAALQRADRRIIREQFGVVLQRTVDELNGTSCLELEQVAKPQQQIMCSRSFGREVTTLSELREAILAYSSRAAERLRKQELLATGLVVFAHTNPFADVSQYSRSVSMSLPGQTDHTRVIASQACTAVPHIFKDGVRFKKAGAMLTGLVPRTSAQSGLFSDAEAEMKDSQLDTILDTINRRFGRGALSLGGATRPRAWSMKRSTLSPSYTTDWDAIPKVNTGDAIRRA